MTQKAEIGRSNTETATLNAKTEAGKLKICFGCAKMSEDINILKGERLRLKAELLKFKDKEMK